jgi:hypothetical protein
MTRAARRGQKKRQLVRKRIKAGASAHLPITRERPVRRRDPAPVTVAFFHAAFELELPRCVLGLRARVDQARTHLDGGALVLDGDVQRVGYQLGAVGEVLGLGVLGGEEQARHGGVHVVAVEAGRLVDVVVGQDREHRADALFAEALAGVLERPTDLGFVGREGVDEGAQAEEQDPERRGGEEELAQHVLPSSPSAASDASTNHA